MSAQGAGVVPLSERLAAVPATRAAVSAPVVVQLAVRDSGATLAALTVSAASTL